MERPVEGVFKILDVSENQIIRAMEIYNYGVIFRLDVGNPLTGFVTTLCVLLGARLEKEMTNGIVKGWRIVKA